MCKRLPEFQSILQVYAVIAVMFAGWTLIAFFWKLSAWLLLLNLGEILTLLSYALTANFLESILILFLLLLLSALLPAHLLREDFVVRGTFLSVGMIGSLMAFVGSQMRFGLGVDLRVLVAPLLLLVLMIVLLNRSSQLPRLHSAVMWFSDRVVVFLFILIPMFAMTSLYVLFRNIT